MTVDFPKTIKAALDQYPMADEVDRSFSFEHGCEGARHHSPMPLIVHLTQIGDTDKKAWLCATCRDNLSVLQHFIIEHYGDVPWVLRREFGNILRALAFEGWGAQEPTVTGEEANA